MSKGTLGRMIRGLVVGTACMAAPLAAGCGAAEDLPDPPALSLRSVARITSAGYQPATEVNKEYQVLPAGVVRIEVTGFTDSALYSFKVCITGLAHSCPDRVLRDDLRGSAAVWTFDYDASASNLYFYVVPRDVDRKHGPVTVSIRATLKRESQTLSGPELIVKLVERPPAPKAIVPSIEGLRSDEAYTILDNAGFKQVSYNLSSPTVIDATKLVVFKQDPPAGTQVDIGSTVTYSLTNRPPDPGWKSIQVTNRHVNQREMTIHLWSPSTGWKQVGNPLGYGQSVTANLSTGIYYLVAVDMGLVGCNDGAPDNVSCQRYLLPIRGDSGGQLRPVEIP